MQTPVNSPSATPMPDQGVVKRFFAVVKEGRLNAVGDYLRNFPALRDHAGSPTGGTAIVTAAEEGHLNVVALLANSGANIFAADSGDQSALFYAGLKGEPLVAEYLISHGVDPAVKNRSGISPIDIAIASEFHSLGAQMKRHRAEYVEQKREEARLKQEAELKAMRDNIQQVTEIVGGGLPEAIAAPAKAAFKKPVR